MGMRLSDFRALRPEEFSEAAASWNTWQEEIDRGEWERMRLQSTMLLQPHVQGKLTPKGLLPFPWEKRDGGEAPESLTYEERLRLAREALERLNQADRPSPGKKP